MRFKLEPWRGGGGQPQWAPNFPLDKTNAFLHHRDKNDPLRVGVDKTSAFVHHRDKNDPLSSGLGDTLVWLCSLDKNSNIGSTDSLGL